MLLLFLVVANKLELGVGICVVGLKKMVVF